MCGLATTSVFLRFTDQAAGSVLVPDALTAALGRPPSLSIVRGDRVTGQGKPITDRTGSAIVAPFSSWVYRVAPRGPGAVGTVIGELFEGLTNDLSVWDALAATFAPELCLGLFMADENEGIEIGAGLCGVAAERGLSLAVDFHAPPGAPPAPEERRREVDDMCALLSGTHPPPAVGKTRAGLRFADRQAARVLVPDVLTAALGRSPTSSAVKGEPVTRKGKVMREAGGAPVLARFNAWTYAVDEREPGDLDGQIGTLFGALTDDLSIWRPLSAAFAPDLFVGVFMKQGCERLGVGAERLGILSGRGVSLGLDVYEP